MTDNNVPDVSTALCGLWRKHLGNDASLHLGFIAAGGDSLMALRLLRDIEDSFDVEIDFEMLSDGFTIQKLETLVSAASKAADTPKSAPHWVTL